MISLNYHYIVVWGLHWRRPSILFVHESPLRGMSLAGNQLRHNTCGYMMVKFITTATWVLSCTFLSLLWHHIQQIVQSAIAYELLLHKQIKLQNILRSLKIAHSEKFAKLTAYEKDQGTSNLSNHLQNMHSEIISFKREKRKHLYKLINKEYPCVMKN